MQLTDFGPALCQGSVDGSAEVSLSVCCIVVGAGHNCQAKEGPGAAAGSLRVSLRPRGTHGYEKGPRVRQAESESVKHNAPKGITFYGLLV